MGSFRLILAVVGLLTSTALRAQIVEPVKWSYNVEKGKGDDATLVMTATIDEGWHLYSQFIPDGGPIKTTFAFEPAASYKLVGSVEEGKPIDYYDKNFEMQLKYFAKKAVFKQKIKVLTPATFSIKGTV